MPKPTFINLPKHKQKHIFSHALAEFARHPYEHASLSEIVSKSGIAKGSMYQYFAGKKGLYKYIVGEVYQRKRDYLQLVWSQTDDFFKLASLYYRRSWHFARQFPQHHQVTVNFWESRDEALRDELLREKKVRNTEFADFLEQGIQSGTIASSTDKEAAWFVYHAVAKSLIDNFLTPDIDVQHHEAYIDSVLTILERGLRPR